MVTNIGPTVHNSPPRPSRSRAHTGTSEVAVTKHLPEHQPPAVSRDRRKLKDRRAPGQSRRPLMDLRSGQDRRHSDENGVDVTA